MDIESLTLDVEQQVDIKAPIDMVFERLIQRFTVNNVRPDGVAMPMKMERFPGGRWYRDLGENTGHCWATVQSIRSPDLLEFSGPMFMSYPVAGHLIIRLKEENGTTRLTLRHRAFGMIDPEHKTGVNKGWSHYVETVKKDCES